MQSPKLIYIGMAKDINERHNDEHGNPCHEHYDDFVKMKESDKQIAYACCPIGVFADRLLVESALIYKLQPPINIKQRYSYHHKRTRLTIESKIEFPFVGTFDIEQAN